MGNGRHLVLATALLAVAGLAQDPVFDEVALRVASVRPGGKLVIDRGNRDHVEVGDRVVLLPRGGAILHAVVREIEERSALVELIDRTATVPVGSKGHVLVPRARLAAPTPPPPAPVEPANPDVPKPVGQEPDAPVVAPTPRQPEEEPWRPGMPLLGTTRPPHPKERPARATGYLYAGANLVRTLDTFSHSYARTGADMEVENVDGLGSTLRFAGEFDWSTEYNGETGTDLRLFEFSYERGGTRGEPLRWQVGRFLPRDMPEFGLLDGAEIGYRRENGDRFGASLGYLPELDDDMNSFEDLQVAAWYLWNADLGERTSWGLGYQKSWHHSKQDRDLLVAKLRVLPSEGWDFATTIWLDYYYGRDDGKGTTFGLTRALVSTSRRWQGGSGLEFHYDHEEYPELLRQELPQTLLPQTILDAHNDRLTGHAYWRTDGGSLWRLRATGWTDQDASGGTVEIGCEFDGLLQSAARTGLTLFEVQGLTSSVTGVRVDHGGDFSFGRLDMLYELGLVHHDDQPTDRDDMLQHRLGALCTSDLGGQWSGTFFADATLWDSEFSYGLGIYLQRRF
ncbi:MAG: hypothetical protein H6838_00795 [Planctomycetes bacterium]|nr:hypothetical protein [Planctomycetota bacterium]MCB9883992.1 hypothetical protein [Planctomycetota bacterium]